MRAIYRQPIEVTDLQTITGPGARKVLSVEDRRGVPEVWYTVDTEAPEQDILVWVVGTGHPIPEECLKHGHYVGHFLAVGGTFVGHVYATVNGETAT